METSEFQIESPKSISIEREPWRTGSNQNCNRIDHHALIRLVLGIAIRGDTVDSDCEFLNELFSPEDSKAFVAIGNSFVYPGEGQLFPLEDITGAIQLASTAHFQHHVCSPSEGPDRRLWKVQSAVVDKSDGEAVLLGFMIPRGAAVYSREHSRFGELVLEYRKIRAEQAGVISRVHQYLGSHSATVVVTDEGQVVVANKSAGTLLGQKPEALIGRPFESMESGFRSALPDHRLSMRRISETTPGLSLVTLDLIQPVPVADDLFAADFFAYNMRQKLSNITAAASFLLDDHDRPRVDKDVALIDLILEQGRLADQLLTYMTLLLDYGRLSRDQVDMTAALGEARDNCQVVGEFALDSEKSPQVFAPRKAVVAMFEAIFKAHGSDASSRLDTSVVIKATQISEAAEFEFVTHYSAGKGNSEDNSTWMDFARRLAVRIGLEIISTLTPDKSQMRTEIKIRHDNKIK